MIPYEIPMRWQDNLPFSWFNPTVAHIFGASFPNFARFCWPIPLVFMVPLHPQIDMDRPIFSQIALPM
jgi:hypothetical protein